VPESGPVIWPLEAQRGYGRGTTASEGQRRTKWHTGCKGTLIWKEILRVITGNAPAISPPGSVQRALLIF
jgi:hypothetical protein